MNRPLLSAYLLAACALPALAGPDVTHSDLHDTAKYGPVSIGGSDVYGYAWGSNTCNIGNQSLSWVNGGSPALAMNAYRIFDGRIQQIGLGWCKHSCCVANGNGCSTLTCSSVGTGLRPGCRDVYSASFNGGQGRLGPRSGINAYDSTFAPVPSFSGDAVSRRVQIGVKEMGAADLPNAQFFAEGVYVCLEEAPVDALNNATYRRMTVANSGASPTFAWSVAGTSQVGRPAIYAWAEHGLGPNIPDPGVKVAVSDILGEGRLFMAGKVRSVAGGLYTYDYAIYNLNSHRSAASFSVPLPASASFTAYRFAAPSYQVGEPYDNSPWVTSRSGDSLTIRTAQTFAQNPNSNPVRWGTLYAFSFTTNAAPATALGNVNIGLFRPGTPATTPAAGLPLPCVGPIAQSPLAQISACRDLPVNIEVAQLPSAFPLTYQWQVEDLLVPGTFTNVIDAPGPCGIAGATTASLSFSCVTLSDQGLYRCIVSSTCGSTNSPTTQLNVCIGDFNCDGGIDGPDIESFFVAWSAAAPYADVDASGGIDGTDIFLFLERWASGC